MKAGSLQSPKIMFKSDFGPLVQKLKSLAARKAKPGHSDFLKIGFRPL